MKKLKLSVNLPRHRYNIFISESDLLSAALYLKKHLREKKIYIITNNTIKRIYRSRVEAVFHKHLQIVWISIADGERYKNLTTCEKILTTLSNMGANRQSALLALGGGVVGDITGFVAATYMRGIDYYQMPTTLLAQVDSSVGGKTGVDLITGKNLVGAFYQPQAVFILTMFLKTLPHREFKCGMAEVIKYSIIRDEPFFRYLNTHATPILNLEGSALARIIFTCCALKAAIVREDEKEASLRAILNLGHTLGHAIETLSAYKKYKHGEAVAIGTVFAAEVSYELGVSRMNHAPQIVSLLKLFGLPTGLPNYGVAAYLKAIFKDKKAMRGIIKFILVKKIGRAAIIPLTRETLKKCLKKKLKN